MTVHRSPFREIKQVSIIAKKLWTVYRLPSTPSRFLLCILLLPAAFTAYTQQINLVVNGNFEAYSQCPDRQGGIGYVSGPGVAPGWSNPNFQTPDYFNVCAPSPPTAAPGQWMGVPQNAAGYEPAHSGNGYAGFFTSYSGTESAEQVQEFLQGTLSAPLNAGKAYYFEMFVSRAESPNLNVPNTLPGFDSSIGVFFSDTLIKPHNDYINSLPDLIEPQVLHTGAFISFSGWTKVSGYYTATGQEKHFIIGLFKPVLPTAAYVYFYIDDVALKDCTPYTAPPGFLGNDTVLCTNLPLALSAFRPDSGVLYNWFSPPGTGKSISPVYYATKPGLYRVEVSVNGCPPYSDSIYVDRAYTPAVNLGPDSIACLRKPILLQSSPDYTDSLQMRYTWNTGDTIPSILIDQPGPYWLEMNNRGCKSRDTISIFQFPLKEFSLGPDTAVCDNLPIPYLLDATSIGATGYRWNTPDTTASIYALQSGLYWGEAYNLSCVFRDSVSIDLKAAPAVELGNDTAICENATLMLDAGSRDGNAGVSWSWNKGGTEQFYEAKEEGFYKVTATRESCITEDSVFIYTDPAILVDLGNDTLLCEGHTLVLDATFAGATYRWHDNMIAPVRQVTAAGKYIVTLKRGACTVSDSVEVSMEAKPVFSLGNDSSSCFEIPVVLDASASAAGTYLWQDGSTAPVYTATTAGLYWVEVTRSVCTVRDSVLLTQYPLPEPDLGPDTFFCEGGVYTIDPAAEFSAYLWNDNTTASIKQATTAGMYWLTVQNQYGCAGTDSVAIGSKPLPVFSLGKTIRACQPDTVITPGEHYRAYLWQDGSVSSTYPINDYGIYRVKVTDDNNCEQENQVEVLNNCPASVYVPNAFTPNGDGVNDVFIPVVFNIRSLTLQVYDRWGQLVFETHELNRGWNGKYGNTYAISDVYVYKISYVDTHNEPGIRSGNVTLLR